VKLLASIYTLHLHYSVNKWSTLPDRRYISINCCS